METTTAIGARLPERSSSKFLRRSVLVVVIGWTIYNWAGLIQIRHELHRVPILVVAFLLFEICFDVGLVMVVAGAGGRVFAGTGPHPMAWFSALRTARISLRSLVHPDTTPVLYRWGLYLNWLGAVVTTGIIPIIGVFALLPSRNWPLLYIPLLDIVATFKFRSYLRPTKGFR